MKFTSFLLYSTLSIVLVTPVRSKSTQNANDRSPDYEHRLTGNQGNRRMIGEFYHPTMKQKYRNHLKKRAQQNSYGENGPKPKSCGIMYRNKEPIGILQPFEESYKLIPVKHQKIDLELNEVPLGADNFGSVFPRKTEELNLEDLEEETNLSQDNAKVEENLDPSSFMMMNVPKRKRNVVSKERRSVEDQLKDILDDMGLIDEDLTVKRQDKRMVKEDENLEEGVNNISMVKEKDDSRKDSKRSESASFPVESQMMNDDDVVSLKNVQMRDERAVKRKRHLKSNEGKINAERKLNFLLDSVRWKARTAMPIIGKRAKEAHRNKRDDEQNNTAINAYEERVQRNVQSKIRALKEEVKREIETLQGTTAVNEFIRKKRESQLQKKPNTLLDVETSDVNPVLNLHQELKPYIRRRRQLFKDTPITLVKYDVMSASNDSNVSVASVAPAPSVATPTVLPPSNTSAPPIPPPPNQTGEGVAYSKNFKCNANNTEINISFANGLQNIHISMNVTPSSSESARQPVNNNKRQIADRIMTEPTTVIVPKNLFDKLTLNIDDPLLNQNQNEIDQIIAPSMKNEVVLNDGLPNYNYKRSCDSGNCGVNNAGETCNCNTAGCSCGNIIRKTRYADDYEDVDNDKREIKEIDEDNEGLLEEDNSYENEENYPSQKATIRRVVRNGEKSEYYIDMNPDIYHVASYDGEEDYLNRRKRFDMDDVVALHGGTATRNHLNGIKSRSNSHSRVRRRIDREPNEDPIQLIDLSDEDIFGALPQSFEGELGRYKRVKR